jgi:hypothetical protein
MRERVRGEPAPTNCTADSAGEAGLTATPGATASVTATGTVTSTIAAGAAVTRTATPRVTPGTTITPSATITPATTLYVGDGFEGVIFGDGDWAPAPTTIAALEARLEDYIAEHQSSFSADKPPMAERVRGYKRQYWGEIEEGRRVVFVNAMCRAPDVWKQNKVLVLDGGDCFFQVKYDPERGIFYDLQVNGEA